VAFLFSRPWTIFRNQVKSRIDSPAHAGEFLPDILQAIQVKDLASRIRQVTPIPQHMTLADFKTYFTQTEQHYFPVVDSDGKFCSIFSINDVRAVLFSPEVEPLIIIKDIGTSEIIATTLSEDLNTVLQKFTIKNIDSLPVVNEDDHRALVGMLNRREVIAYYNEQIQKAKAASAA